MGTVSLPIDNLLRIANLVVDASLMTALSVPGMPALVYEIESSYRLKNADLLSVLIDELHPAWWYSGEDFHTPLLPGTSIFRANPADKGIAVKINIPNPKLDIKSTTLDNIEFNEGVSRDFDIPVQYSGSSQDDIAPTVITNHITSPNVKIRKLSPIELEIEVTGPLTEEVQFSLPISNPRLTASTVWGETGDESTLPVGAVVGIIKVKTEVKLTTENGMWKDQDARRLFTAAPFSVSNMANNAGSSGPAWFYTLEADLKATDLYVAAEAFLLRDDLSFYKLGYQHSTCVVGTGIFVFDKNQVGTVPWANVAEGYTYGKSFNASTLNDTLSLREALDFTDFRSNFLSLAGTGGGLTKIANKRVLPIVAADIQAIKLEESAYAPLQNVVALYPNKTPSAAMQVTPLYITAQTGYHCYTPPQTYRQGFRIHQIDSRNLDEEVLLWLQCDPDLTSIHGHEGYSISVPDRFLGQEAISTTSWAESSNLLSYFKHMFGFSFARQLHVYTRTFGSGASSYTVTYHDYFGMYGFINQPTASFTIGMNSEASAPSVIPTYSVMSTMCIGKLAAGTPVGIYKFKPFSSYTTAVGSLDAREPLHVKLEMTAQIEGDRTDVPYLGLNIITIDTQKYRWTVR